MGPTGYGPTDSSVNVSNINTYIAGLGYTKTYTTSLLTLTTGSTGIVGLTGIPQITGTPSASGTGSWVEGGGDIASGP